MKKNICSLIIPLVVLAFAIVLGGPSQLQAQISCPPGFTCTSVSSPIYAKIVGSSVNTSNYYQNGTVWMNNFVTYKVFIQAGNKDIILASPTSWVPAFSTTSASISIKKNGAPDNLSNYNVFVNYTLPLKLVNADNGYYSLPAGTSVVVPVTYKYVTNDLIGALYSFQLNNISYLTDIHNYPSNATIQSLSEASSTIISLDPISPISSTVLVTDSVRSSYLGLPLLVFDIKSKNYSVTLNGVTAQVTSPLGGSAGTISRAYLYQGSALVSSGIVKDNLVQFDLATSSIGSFIPANSIIPYTIKADISNVGIGNGFTVQASVRKDQVKLSIGNTSGIPVSQEIDGSAIGSMITVVRNNSVQPPVTSSTTCPVGYICNQGGAYVSNSAALLGPAVFDNNGAVKSYPVTFRFILTASSSPIYVGSQAGTNATSTIYFASNSQNIIPTNRKISTNPIAIAGDSVRGYPSDYFIVPAHSSRQFTLTGILNSSTSTYIYNYSQIIAIRYGTNPRNLYDNVITSGLEALKVSPYFSGGILNCPAGFICSAQNSTTTPIVATSSLPASVKVLSPNGGEQYKIGDTMNIRWSSSNIPSGFLAVIALIGTNPSGYNVDMPVSNNCNTSTGCVLLTRNYANYVIPAKIPVGQYKIKVMCWPNTYQPIECPATDTSDNYFTIGSSSPTTYVTPVKTSTPIPSPYYTPSYSPTNSPSYSPAYSPASTPAYSSTPSPVIASSPIPVPVTYPSPTAAPVSNQTRINSITQLYTTLLNRQPDAQGLNYFVNSSMTIDQIRSVIISSQEYRNLHTTVQASPTSSVSPVISPNSSPTTSPNTSPSTSPTNSPSSSPSAMNIGGNSLMASIMNAVADFFNKL